ncbi:hypothetical protein Belba_2938 [Belliella baltica DSM 15883]|uniref:DUF3784 domain-containing protein n=1 Tax=Belliella baltica (strain DSM 15883 / CIP 108006 / LMG 21964 / BA134) TaxID=866536 RepID=I3Z8A0_BELBD|nr:DUF3784 domain-containing protein [Belliella baltica]AFL85468.1 hypothetical protein Belba_2938 [Belliella baltica DSM 15883]
MDALMAGVLYLIIGFVVRIFPNIIAGYNSLSQRNQERASNNGLPFFAFVLFSLMGILCIISYPVSLWLEMPNLTSGVQLSVTLVGVVIFIVFGNLLANHR